MWASRLLGQANERRLARLLSANLLKPNALMNRVPRPRPVHQPGGSEHSRGIHHAGSSEVSALRGAAAGEAVPRRRTRDAQLRALPSDSFPLRRDQSR